MSQNLPQGAYLQDISAHYNHLTLPRAMRRAAPLPSGIWGRVVVEQGALKLFLDGSAQATAVVPGSPALVPEGVKFRLEEIGSALSFYLEYHHVAQLEDGAELASLLSRKAAHK